MVDRVRRRVNVVVGQVKLGLNGKGRGVACLGERSVVGTGVATLGLADADVDCSSVTSSSCGKLTVSLDSLPDELGKRGRDKVVNQAHVLLSAGLDPG